ncbi:MAG TPA: hypothetical protein VMS88_04595 [Terriglobales bacterium]|nr:hypothetical protein [Terriglobales bacterium]
MIQPLRPPREGGAGDRLLGALARRGHAIVGAEAAPPVRERTIFVCPAPGEDVSGTRESLKALVPAQGSRLLVITRLGTHPDAAHASLRDLWTLEETARAAAIPSLVLRLAPMLGPRSPLWLRLASASRLGRRADLLLNPVVESDVIETLDRALSGRAEWRGWFEIAGPEVWSLGELADLARACGRGAGEEPGSWEPPIEEMEEHRLAEAGRWLEHFGMTVRPLSAQAGSWAAMETERSA